MVPSSLGSIPDTCSHIKAHIFTHALHLMKTWACVSSSTPCVLHPLCLGNCSTFALRDLPHPLNSLGRITVNGCPIICLMSPLALVISGFNHLLFQTTI